MAMRNGGGRITQERYGRLIESFRERPGVFDAAARHAGTSWKTARRGWETGWPKRGMRPIKELLEEEKQAARAKLEEEERKVHERERANRDAAHTREREALLVREGRENCLGYHKSIKDLLDSAQKLAGYVRKQLEQMIEDGIEIEPGTATRLLQQIGTAIKQANEASILAMRMERLLVGEPEEIVGVKDMTPERSVSEIDKANHAVERARQKGLIPIDGGQAANKAS